LTKPGRAGAQTASRCEDCYFRKNLLCALELEKPCATFRPDRPEGLVPPRQPVLLMRTPRWADRIQPAATLSGTAGGL
jgi:hypothetical protein